MFFVSEMLSSSRSISPCSVDIIGSPPPSCSSRAQTRRYAHLVRVRVRVRVRVGVRV